MYGSIHHLTIFNKKTSSCYLYLVNLEFEENNKESIEAKDLKMPNFLSECYLIPDLSMFNMASVRLNFYYLINFSSSYLNTAVFLPPKQ
jgi:hypothetical protein